MAEFGSTADSGRCLSLTAGPATSRAAETRWIWPARARRSLDREARPGRRYKRSSGAQRKVRLVGSDREPPDWALPAWDTIDVVGEPRSEERRVGKEWRARGTLDVELEVARS